MLDVIQVYWYQTQFGVALSEVEYLINPCMSTQLNHLCTFSIIFLLHLL